MDYKYIEQLLDRYFEAETTLKEEQILKAFFEQSEEELPESLRQYKPLFAAMEQDETLGDDFDARLLEMTEEKMQVKAHVISLSDRMRPLMRAAAVVAILLQRPYPSIDARCRSSCHLADAEHRPEPVVQRRQGMGRRVGLCSEIRAHGQ